MIFKKLLDIEKFEQSLIDRCKGLPKISIAVAHPCSTDALNGVVEAANVGLNRSHYHCPYP